MDDCFWLVFGWICFWMREIVDEWISELGGLEEGRLVDACSADCVDERMCGWSGCVDG